MTTVEIKTIQTFDDVLDYIDKTSKSTTVKGAKFEKLTREFLLKDRQFAKRFKEVHMWNKWPDRKDDRLTGIDLMAVEHNGEWCAIQCKFYDKDKSSTVDDSDVSKFLSKATSLEKKHKRTVNTLFAYTTHRITREAESKLKYHKCYLMGRDVFRSSSIDWSMYPKWHVKPVKELYPHQLGAMDNVMDGFKRSNRGKMIMACGTGKTLTSLRIAEKIVGNGYALYLVPSISLIRQTIREWSENAKMGHHYCVVCSDKSSGDEGSVIEVPFPPTTDKDEIKKIMYEKPLKSMCVVFSTYQSIEQVSKAMEGKKFDLILCDEAHRTTGIEGNEKDSPFIMAHKDEHVQSAKRLYMTATERIYGEKIRSEKDVFSMDDEESYGPLFHEFTFGEAVAKGLLTEYKIRVPILREEELADGEDNAIDEEGRLDERILFGSVWKGLNYDNERQKKMLQRVIAFTDRIKASQEFAGKYKEDDRTQDEDDKEIIDRTVDRSFNRTVSRLPKLRNLAKKGKFNGVQVRHIDGTMRSGVRAAKLDWLGDSGSDPETCRILSNAKCLSEGVDVPNLDGIIFLKPRKSKVDVIQSVGRVMRRAGDEKEYGYIILPIILRRDMTLAQSMEDEAKWKTVWQVIKALQSHDKNLVAEINRLAVDGNGETPEGPDGLLPGCVEIIYKGDRGEGMTPVLARTVATKLIEVNSHRQYFELKARKLGKTAKGMAEVIQRAYDRGNKNVVGTVDELCLDLKKVVNDSVDEKETVKVLAQHKALSEVFNVLFAEEFRSSNPVASALDAAMRKIGLTYELEDFERFYKETRNEMSNFRTVKGKQELIKKIYGSFLEGFDPDNQSRNGIVYTPDEVIDFIIHSVQDVLKHHFKSSLTDTSVKVFDPFTGTGAFVTHLLESGLIGKEKLYRKYKHDIWVNELSLLAYYVASVNIESTYASIRNGGHVSFESINYTDTLTHHPTQRVDKSKRGKIIKLAGKMEEINENIQKINMQHIHVIMGNPPYSFANENAKYPLIDARIKDTYAMEFKRKYPEGGNINSLFDSYIRSIRWASDRIGNAGVIAFVTNAGFLRNSSAAGLRVCLKKEFNEVWCFDLRGRQVGVQGKESDEEGGKIFGSGSRTPVVITILVRNPKLDKKDQDGNRARNATVYYRDYNDIIVVLDPLTLTSSCKACHGRVIPA
ncbi:helicase [Cenarchaeum symbiosum A]|uniref:Helicase n=1 Tax=Cenarchaeum symbiosum (strain A) TaxID=414004 RepID=A0RWC4_CENSY|nr:helicase [Cenarchaeum symbiosum A]